MKDKDSLRMHYLKLLKGQNREDLVRKSAVIAEVDTWMMIEKAFLIRKRVALPIVEQNKGALIPTLISSMEDVHKGTYGILEPHLNPDRVVAVKDLDVVIVPGLAFDKHHNRLGRGAGYYDRFLSTLPKTVTTVGLAFDFQLTESLPVEAHDVRLGQIIAG